ncbi:MAG: sulfur oxidation protein SoxY [Betaproteobacteria bacterium]|nr:sulfur oxidation protein SoxY [Betaproteobacteria bacterium]
MPQTSHQARRRAWLRHSLGCWAALGFASQVKAQGMVSGKLLSLSQMLDPIVAGAKLVRADVHIETVILADNGLSVPFRVWVDSPMTAQNHVTHLWLLSQRNPVTVMAKAHLGPHSGRAELSTRLRLAGGQQLVALARLSSGEFRYELADLIVTEAGCVDSS